MKAPRRHPGRAALAALHIALREHSLLIALVTLHLAAAAAMPSILGRRLTFQFSLVDGYRFLGTIGLLALVIVAAADIVISAVRARTPHPLAHAWRRIADHHLKAARWIGGVMVMALLPIFAISFGFLEAMIPILHKFTWDPTFAGWDRWLHFGRQPWEWLQPLLGHPVVTSALSAAYASWFFVLYAVMFWQAFSMRDRVLRMQYFMSSILIWILVGNLGGTLLASAGPIYYGRVTGLPDPFAPLLDYLRAASLQAPNFTLSLQERLWQVYLENGRDGVINGNVTAMPSLHVAIAFSLFLVGRATHPILGVVFGLFTLVILVATVHLGWHYAIDGYAGILGTLAIWCGVGRTLRIPALARWLWPAEDARGWDRIPGNATAGGPLAGSSRGTR
jgi:hypothetical protein